MFFQQTQQMFDDDRLEQKIIKTGAERPLAGFFKHVRRDRDNMRRAGGFHLRLSLPNALRRAESVQHRHAQIQKNQFRPRLQRKLNALFALFRKQHVEAERNQQPGQNRPIRRFIVHDENHAPTSGVADNHALDKRVAAGLDGNGAKRQIKPERAALPRFAGDVQRSAHQRDKFPADGQPQARALR